MTSSPPVLTYDTSYREYVRQFIEYMDAALVEQSLIMAHCSKSIKKTVKDYASSSNKV